MGFIAEVTRDLQFIVSVVRLRVGQTTKILELLYFKGLAHSRLCTYRIVSFWSRTVRRASAKITVYVAGCYKPFRVLKIEYN
jgi:hypothetical protein